MRIGIWKGSAVVVFILGTLAGAQSVLSTSELAPYATCTFSDGLQVVRTDMLPPGVTSRPVNTDKGSRLIDMEAGERIMFAYPETDFYANVKAEKLPAAKYDELKGYLLENFELMAHGNTKNTALKSPMNGLEVYGLDREKIEGGVLGIYLLFNPSDKTVTTIYLLNQQPESRKFHTMDEYRALRDRFLATYSKCIHDNLLLKK